MKLSYAVLWSALLLSSLAPAGAQVSAPTPADSATATPAPDALASPPQGTVVTVPGGTHVPVHVVGSLSSSSAKVGDTFQIECARDVVVDGMVVIPAGAEGEGSVAKVDHAGGNGHSGSLALQFDWISSADGGRIQLSNVDQTQAEQDRKGASSTATIIGFATLGLGGLFAHNFAHGKDVVIDQRTKLNAFVAQTVHVTATRTGQGARYDH